MEIPNCYPDVKLPMQPIYLDENGTARFRGNAVVRYLLEEGGVTLNGLAGVSSFPRRDRDQFHQLIGYSVSGFSELNPAPKTLRKADKKVAKLLKKKGK